ncbi:hypothetical protein CRYUN_Cryun24cG0066100 [Craigia yunnanensis]
MVRDFGDLCFHSYLLYLKELIHVPGLIVVGLLGLIVDIPSYTIITVVKSPYMLFEGCFRLTHDLISREGPFLETVCIPIAGLTILFWPIVVIGSILVDIFSSFFIGLYRSVIVYQPGPLIARKVVLNLSILLEVLVADSVLHLVKHLQCSCQA